VQSISEEFGIWKYIVVQFLYFQQSAMRIIPAGTVSDVTENTMHATSSPNIVTLL
jgi:hypothetical protein